MLSTRRKSFVQPGIWFLLCSGLCRCGLAEPPGIEIRHPITYRLKISMRISAEKKPLSRVAATCPIPVDWREQKAKLLSEKKPDGSKSRERTVDGMGALWVWECPKLAAGESVAAERIYEITRFEVVCKLNPETLKRPPIVPRNLRDFLRDSPGIEMGDSDLKALAEKLGGSEKPPWEFAVAARDWIRQHTKYQPGPYRGAKYAFEERRGDCEDLSALWIALCRISKIPARTVWVEGHAYPEFYLEDGEKRGDWIPVELHGPEAFGRIRQFQPILQKGDQYRDPATRQRIRYLPQQATAFGGLPKLQVTRTVLREKPAE